MTRARQNADNVAGDISGVTAGTGLTGGGTSGTVTLTNDMATTINAAGDLIYGTGNDAYSALSIGTAGKVLKVNSGATAPEWAVDPTTDVVTTAGDLIYGTGADAVTRLGIGTASQVLTVNSGATAPEWAALPASGAFTEITTTTINNTVTSYTYSSLGSYKHIFISGSGLQYDGVGTNDLRVRFNGDTGSNYQYATIHIKNQNTPAGETNVETFITCGNAFGMTNDPSIRFGNFGLWFYDYRGSGYKNVYFNTRAYPGTNQALASGSAMWNNTSAITSITIFTGLGNNLKAGIIKVYGVN